MLYFFVYIRYLYNVQVIFCILTGWLTSVSWRRIHSNTIPLLHLIAIWYYATRLIFIHKSTTRKKQRNWSWNILFGRDIWNLIPNDLETIIINMYYSSDFCNLFLTPYTWLKADFNLTFDIHEIWHCCLMLFFYHFNKHIQ